MKTSMLSMALAYAAFSAGCSAGEPAFDALGGDAEATPPATAAHALLERSITYHDPANEWSGFQGSLQLEELRPDGAGRTASLMLDVPTSGMVYRAEVDGREVVREVSAQTCGGTVDGQAPSSEEAESLRLTCPQVERSRNYYLYLWGLPMKLRDPGTHLDPEVVDTTFQGEPVQQIRVTYDAEVGGDTWYFYFHPETDALVGYRFYHDEAVGDGEYIVLDGEVTVGSMRIPASRSWYVNADDRFLGEDVLLPS